MFDSRHAIRCD